MLGYEDLGDEGQEMVRGREHALSQSELMEQVMDGVVDMHYRIDGVEKIVTLEAGDVFYADVGCEHVAHPRGASRILVVEKEGSV